MRQQLGAAPVNGTDAATKAYVDSKVGTGGSFATINVQAANTWVRIARVTMAAQYDGASADITLLAGPDGYNTVNMTEVKVRAGQRAAFGTAPAADIVLMRASTMTVADIGYVIVQSSGPSIVDFYIRISDPGRQYSISGVIAPNANGVLTFINQEAGSTTAPSGLVNGSQSTDLMFHGQLDMGSARIINQANPVNAQDGATKFYVDNAVMDFTPPRGPIGWWTTPQGHIPSTGTTLAPTSGRQTFMPFSVVSPVTIDQIACYLSTAASGGAYTFQMGIYTSDSDGMPASLVPGAVGSTSTLTTVGNIIVTLGTAAALTPGIYWLSSLYVASTAPSTAPVFRGVTNPSYQMPMASITATAIGTGIRGYGVNSRTAATFSTAITPSSITTYLGDNSQVMMYVRRSA